MVLTEDNVNEIMRRGRESYDRLHHKKMAPGELLVRIARYATEGEPVDPHRVRRTAVLALAKFGEDQTNVVRALEAGVTDELRVQRAETTRGSTR